MHSFLLEQIEKIEPGALLDFLSHILVGPGENKGCPPKVSIFMFVETMLGVLVWVTDKPCCRVLFSQFQEQLVEIVQLGPNLS